MLFVFAVVFFWGVKLPVDSAPHPLFARDFFDDIPVAGRPQSDVMADIYAAIEDAADVRRFYVVRNREPHAIAEFADSIYTLLAARCDLEASGKILVSDDGSEALNPAYGVAMASDDDVRRLRGKFGL